jgi:hypothetical protein
MSHSPGGFLSALACAALAVLAGLAAGQGADDAVARAKKLIEANAEKICKFAHAPSTYAYKGKEFIGQKKTKDGHLELTYKFDVKGNLKMQKMYLSFFFKDNGQFEFLRVKDSTTLYEPFKKLSASYLKQLRGDMAKRPAAQANTDLLRVIDRSDAQELCEMYLKQVQAAEGKR